MQCTKLRDFLVWYENGEEFHSLKREIFTEHIYSFESLSNSPIIVDVGAHIGISTLYFKMLYPRAHILAIEPFEENFKILKKNVESNRLTDVSLFQFAVGLENTLRDFYVDETSTKWHSTGSFIPHAWNNQQQTKQTLVEVRRLSQLLPKKVDLLKLDVEGAEEEVLEELGIGVQRIKKIIFEFHPAYGKTPEKLERLFSKNGFEVVFWQKGRQVDWQKVKGLLVGEASAKSKGIHLGGTI